MTASVSLRSNSAPTEEALAHAVHAPATAASATVRAPARLAALGDPVANDLVIENPRGGVDGDRLSRVHPMANKTAVANAPQDLSSVIYGAMA